MWDHADGSLRTEDDAGGTIMTRRELREHCFKMLFEADFYPREESAAQLEQYFLVPEEEDTTPEGEEIVVHKVEMGENDQNYLKHRTEEIIQRIPELDEKINQVAEGWKTKRMGRVELAILRLAVYEMKYDPDIPEKVAINEAVELAKRFGPKEAPSFINGILAKLV